MGSGRWIVEWWVVRLYDTLTYVSLVGFRKNMFAFIVRDNLGGHHRHCEL